MVLRVVWALVAVGAVLFLLSYIAGHRKDRQDTLAAELLGGGGVAALVVAGITFLDHLQFQ